MEASQGIQRENPGHFSYKNFQLKYGREGRYILRSIEKISLQNVTYGNQIAFLRKCVNEGLTPKGMKLRRFAESANINKILVAAERKLILEQLNILHKNIRTNGNQEKTLLIAMYRMVSYQEFNIINQVLNARMINYHKKDLARLEKKFNNLLNNNNTNYKEVNQGRGTRSHSEQVHGADNQAFTNLSDTELNQDAVRLFAKGSNYAVRREHNLMNNIAQLDGVCQDDEKRSNLAHYLDHRVLQLAKNKEELKNDHVVQDIKQNKDIKLVKADKGGQLVIMKREKYEQQLHQIVETNYTKLQRDPTNKLVAQLRRFVTQELRWTPKKREELAPRHPKTPSVYGQPKTHKEGNPLRIIVAQKNTCYSNMAKHLNSKLKKVLPAPDSSVKNGKEFIDHIRSGKAKITETTTMFTIDVVDMFSNIEIPKALEALEEKLRDVDDKEFTTQLLMTKAQCVKLVELIISNNYFRYKDDFYQNNKGLAMGSPLSPLLADLVMQQVETKILTIYKKEIDLWKRYMDDTCVNWLGMRTDTNTFLETINQIEPNIKFTLEMEKENTVNFLDVSVKKTNSGFETEVYKKPTASEGVMHASSFNPQHTKLSIAKQKLRRIDEYFSDTKKKVEAKRELRKTLENKGYTNSMIKRVFTTVEKDNGNQGQNVRYLPLQFDDDIQRNIHRFVERSDLTAAWKQKTTALDICKEPRMPCRNLSLSQAVYVIPCSCSKVYIGETGRPVQIRIKEHQANVKHERRESKIVLHLEKYPGHEMQWDKTFIILTEPDPRVRKKKEAILITLNTRNCISEKSIQLNENWNWLMKKHAKVKTFYSHALLTI